MMIIYLLFAGFGLAIHVWSIILAYFVSGLFAATLTLSFPVISQIYWFFKIGLRAGFDNIYCMAIMGYIGFLVIGFIITILIGVMVEKNKSLDR